MWFVIACGYFFFNDTATTEIYTLSLHDALPIFRPPPTRATPCMRSSCRHFAPAADRKSTRLNSSHNSSSYAVFCLKKKNKEKPDEVTKTAAERHNDNAPVHKAP